MSKDTPELIIRKAVPDDAVEIIAYLNRIGGESDNLLFGENEFHMTAEQEKAYIEKINAAAASVMLVGVIDGAIISVGTINSPSRERIAHTAELAISVAKQWWNQGVGRRMLGELLRFCDNNGITRLVQLSVRADNLGAIKIYRDAGFEEVGRVRGSTRIGERFYDTLIMCRYRKM